MESTKLIVCKHTPPARKVNPYWKPNRTSATFPPPGNVSFDAAKYDFPADIENYLTAVDGVVTERDLAIITEFMEMHLPSTSAVYEQSADIQADYPERDTDEEYSEVSLGSEDDDTYWYSSFQVAEDSNLYLPADIATDGDIPVTYTWVQSGSNSEYSILGDSEYSQQRPNHFSSGPMSMCTRHCPEFLGIQNRFPGAMKRCHQLLSPTTPLFQRTEIMLTISHFPHLSTSFHLYPILPIWRRL